jgi:hypothetical protein
MITLKNKWVVWAVLAVVTFFGAILSLLNFIAAINLGYDITPQEKQTISYWGYAMIGLMVSSIGFFVIVIKSWCSRKKTARQPIHGN